MNKQQLDDQRVASTFARAHKRPMLSDDDDSILVVNENDDVIDIADEIGANGSVPESMDIDKSVQKSIAFENFVIKPYTQKSQSTVWNHFKSLFVKNQDNQRITAVRKMNARVVCAHCFDKKTVKRCVRCNIQYNIQLKSDLCSLFFFIFLAIPWQHLSQL